MEHLLIALPIVLLVVFLALWQKLRREYRRRLDEEASADVQDELDQLLAMKAKLTEEEYRRLRRAVVQKMTERSQGEKPVSKEVNLGVLEKEWMGRKAGQESPPTQGQGERPELK